jgi:AraC-like DNA-binding protein
MVRLQTSMLVFVRYGGDVIVESPPTASRVVATVPLGPMHVTFGSALGGEVTSNGFLLSPQDRTLMRPDPWAGALVFAADEERLTEHRSMVFGEESVPSLAEGYSPMLTHACRRAWSATKALASQAPGPLLDEFLGTVEDQLLTALVLASGAPARPPARGGRRHLEALHEWLTDHHGPGVTATDMARGIGLSIRQLQAVTRDSLGVTPLDLLREVRLGRARELLSTADPDSVTVAHVAHECGFAHLGRFSAAYRRRFGESPSGSLRSRRPRT